MGDISDVTLFIDGATYVKVFFYHVLRLLILGPMTFLVVALFSGVQYAQNLGFGCLKSVFMYFMIETMSWMFLVVAVVLLTLDRLKRKELEDSAMCSIAMV